MTNYFKSLKKEDCNGCGVCELICPKKAITMVTDSEGFLYPTIDKTKCINCKLCEKKCPNIINKKNDYTKTYVSYLLNKVEKEKSSSGGMFYLLSSYIIRNNGVVFGVKYNDKMQAVHDYTKKIVNESIEVIRHRIDETGTKEPTILRQGTNRIVVG